MKKLLLALTIAASFAAQAGEVGRIKNEAGGHIVLMDFKCASGGGWYAIGYGFKNLTIEGCHFAMDDSIMIRWNHDKTLTRYSFDEVQWSEQILEQVRQDRSIKTY